MAADSGGDPTENNSGGGDAVMTCPRPARALLPPTCVPGRTCFAGRRRQRPPPSPVRSFVRSVPRIEIISLAFQRRGPLLISPLSPNTASASSGRRRGAEADGSVVADGDLRGAARLPRRRRRSGFARTRTAIFRRRGGGDALLPAAPPAPSPADGHGLPAPTTAASPTTGSFVL